MNRSYKVTFRVYQHGALMTVYTEFFGTLDAATRWVANKRFWYSTSTNGFTTEYVID